MDLGKPWGVEKEEGTWKVRAGEVGLDESESRTGYKDKDWTRVEGEHITKKNPYGQNGSLRRTFKR